MASLSLFEVVKYYKQWWVGALGIELKDALGYLFYIEHDNGVWKFDLFWLRHLAKNIRRWFNE